MLSYVLRPLVRVRSELRCRCLHTYINSRFYYADERTEEGLPVMRDIDGTAAGKEYLKIAEAPEQLPWLYTYTKDGGYKDFGEKDYLKTVDSNELRFITGGRQS